VDVPQRQRIGAGAILALIGLFVLFVFMVQNTEHARVHFFFWYFDWAIWIVILISALIGGVTWFGAGVVRRYRRGR
jgi:uncharacterized integral membrane protein